MFDPQIHHRRSIRLPGHDYSAPGTYFVTICIHEKEHLLGEVVEGEMHRSEIGEMAAADWQCLPQHYTWVRLGSFVFMPNHLHGLIEIVRAGLETRPYNAVHPPPGLETCPYGLSEIVRGFKTWSARRINEHRTTPGGPVWQRNYYEHIVRNDRELAIIQGYISTNPVRWVTDPEFS